MSVMAQAVVEDGQQAAIDADDQLSRISTSEVANHDKFNNRQNITTHLDPGKTIVEAIDSAFAERAYDAAKWDSIPESASRAVNLLNHEGAKTSKNIHHPVISLPNVECAVRARIPTVSGTDIFLHLYHNDKDAKEHLAFVFGNNIRSNSLDAPRQGESEMDRMIRGAYTGKLFPGRINSYDEEQQKRPTDSSKSYLVRVHSECYTGETAWSTRCDCGEQLGEAARMMASNGEGVIVYLRQEGRGIGLSDKLRAYNLQDLGNDTVEANLQLQHPADARSYEIATAILLDLGVKNVSLLTNNPDKIVAIEGTGQEIHVVERIPMIPKVWRGENGVHGEEFNIYLRTKIRKMGHILESPDDDSSER